MKKFVNFSDGPSGLLGAPGMAPENDPRFLQNVPAANGFLTFLITPSRRPRAGPRARQQDEGDPQVAGPGIAFQKGFI